LLGQVPTRYATSRDTDREESERPLRHFTGVSLSLPRQDHQDVNIRTARASRVETVDSGRPCSAGKQVKEQRNHGKNEQQVNQKSGDVEKHKPASPKNQQKYR
jgi:hypothetical protein